MWNRVNVLIQSRWSFWRKTSRDRERENPSSRISLPVSGPQQPAVAEPDFWLSGVCIAFDSDTVFKPSIGSHYSSPCSSSLHPFDQTTWTTAEHPPTPLSNTFISPIPLYWISIPSLSPSLPLSLSSLRFPFFPLFLALPWNKKSS